MKEQRNRSRKRWFAILLSVVFCFTLIPATAYADSKLIGFPLPVKSTPYNITVLGKYSGGSYHEPYIYEYGPLKGKTPDRNIIMDIDATTNDPIYCVADGKVITNKYGSGGGYYVVVSHPADGSYSYYGHLVKASTLKLGQTIKAGDLIGYVGNTGNSKGDHLHFEWSGHDPFCVYAAKGLVKILPNSGASKYPHKHPTTTPPNSTTTQKNNTTTQKNNTRPISDGIYSLTPQCATGARLDIKSANKNAGANVQIHQNNGSAAQKFDFRYNGDGTYTITSLCSGKVLDVKSAEKRAGANVQQWGVNGSPAQKWKLENLGNGYYTIVSALDKNLVLDVSGAGTANGTNVQIWSRNNTNAQKWKISKVSYGTVKGTDGTLVIRSGPGSSYKQLGLIPEKARIVLDSSKNKNGWKYVTYNGINGYSAGNYIR